jgi:hypothetical protein
MKCDRLISLVKNWYLKVQEEAMAPARMVAFMEKHIDQCEICLADSDVKEEADKIREIVLPPSKAPKPKVVRVPKEDVEAPEAIEEEQVSEEEKEEDEDFETEEDEVEGDDNDEEEDEDFVPDIIDEEI